MIEWKEASKDDMLIVAERLAGLSETPKEGELDEYRAFNCRRCGERYVPFTTQWIFYQLCEDCFRQFNPLRMESRFNKGKGKGYDTPFSFEGVDRWIADVGKQP